MIGWILAGLAAAVVVAALWETFAPFVKSILSKAHRYFRLFVKYIHDKFIGEVELDGCRTYEQEIPEEEVPEEYRYIKYSYTHKVDVTDDEELRLQLEL